MTVLTTFSGCDIWEDITKKYQDKADKATGSEWHVFAGIINEWEKTVIAAKVAIIIEVENYLGDGDSEYSYFLVPTKKSGIYHLVDDSNNIDSYIAISAISQTFGYGDSEAEALDCSLGEDAENFKNKESISF